MEDGVEGLLTLFTAVIATKSVSKPSTPSSIYWSRAIPLLAEEGWRDSLIEAGAPGACTLLCEEGNSLPRFIRSKSLFLRDKPTCRPQMRCSTVLSVFEPRPCSYRENL